MSLFFRQIALAIALDNEVRESARRDENSEIYGEQTQQVFVFVGGIAFMTLAVNGTTAGPLLKYFGLADSTDARQKIIKAFSVRFKAHLLGTIVCFRLVSTNVM